MRRDQASLRAPPPGAAPVRRGPGATGSPARSTARAGPRPGRRAARRARSLVSLARLLLPRCQRMPNLLLIWPRTRDAPIYERLIPTLTMPYLAGLTPAHWTVTFADDNYGEVDEAAAPDLVAISVNTMSAHRAYVLADRFSRPGLSGGPGGGA